MKKASKMTRGPTCEEPGAAPETSMWKETLLVATGGLGERMLNLRRPESPGQSCPGPLRGKGLWFRSEVLDGDADLVSLA